MKKERRKFSPVFKTKVVLTAVAVHITQAGLAGYPRNTQMAKVTSGTV